MQKNYNIASFLYDFKITDTNVPQNFMQNLCHQTYYMASYVKICDLGAFYKGKTLIKRHMEQLLPDIILKCKVNNLVQTDNNAFQNSQGSSSVLNTDNAGASSLEILDNPQVQTINFNNPSDIEKYTLLKDVELQKVIKWVAGTLAEYSIPLVQAVDINELFLLNENQTVNIVLELVQNLSSSSLFRAKITDLEANNIQIINNLAKIDNQTITDFNYYKMTEDYFYFTTNLVPTTPLQNITIDFWGAYGGLC